MYSKSPNLKYCFIFTAEVTIIDHSPSSGKYVIPYNTRARLTCRAAGIPGPSMQWRKNDISVRICALIYVSKKKKSGGLLELLLIGYYEWLACPCNICL